MDVANIQNQLLDNTDKIALVLEKLGYEPRDNGKYFSMRNLDGDNASAIVVWKNSLKYENYTRGVKGNIFTLVMDMRRVSFPDALKLIGKWCGIEDKKIRIRYPFGGFYRALEPDYINDATFKIYATEMLPPPGSLSEKFFKDNIDFLTQERFGVRYDHESDSILIPIYGYHGQLIGCKARRNSNTVDFRSRWYAYLPYSKTSVVYGWYQNYKSIVEKEACIITESEKGVQQLYSMGCYIGIAIGGHDISKAQEAYIKMLGCKKIIVAFDEDVEEEYLEKECAKLKKKSNRVFYIKDRMHKYLKFGSKNAPTDLGKETFEHLMKECLVEYKGAGA